MEHVKLFLRLPKDVWFSHLSLETNDSKPIGHQQNSSVDFNNTQTKIGDAKKEIDNKSFCHFCRHLHRKSSFSGYKHINDENLQDFIRLFPGRTLDKGKICNAAYSLYWKKSHKDQLVMKRNQKRGTEKQREYKEGEGTSKSNVITASEMTSKESFVINVEQNEKQVPQSLSQSSLEHHTHNTNHESTQIKIETNVNDKSSSVPPPPHHSTDQQIDESRESSERNNNTSDPSIQRNSDSKKRKRSTSSSRHSSKRHKSSRMSQQDGERNTTNENGEWNRYYNRLNSGEGHVQACLHPFAFSPHNLIYCGYPLIINSNEPNNNFTNNNNNPNTNNNNNPNTNNNNNPNTNNNNNPNTNNNNNPNTNNNNNPNTNNNNNPNTNNNNNSNPNNSNNRFYPIYFYRGLIVPVPRDPRISPYFIIVPNISYSQSSQFVSQTNPREQHSSSSTSINHENSGSSLSNVSSQQSHDHRLPGISSFNYPQNQSNLRSTVHSFRSDN